MNIANIYKRINILIIKPEESWNLIKQENKSRKVVVKEFLLPVSILIGICSLLGTLFFSNVDASFSLAYVFFNGLISFLIIFLEVYLSSWIITEVATSFTDDVDTDRIFNLVIYSHAPFLITLAITGLFPQLLFIVVLGFFTFYIYWLGIQKMLTIPEDRRMIFFLFSALVMVLIFLLLSVIFNNIYDVVLR
jgi:hypothetical protein